MICTNPLCEDPGCFAIHMRILPTEEPQYNVNRPRPAPSASPSSTLCRFGNRCNRPGCRFSHPSTAETAASASAPRPAPSASPSSTLCHFGNGCNRPDCPFSHPSPAKSGTAPPASAPRASAPRPAAPAPTSDHRAEDPPVDEEIEEVYTEGARRAAAGDPQPNDPRARRHCKNGPGCRGKKNGACPFQH